MNKICTSIEQSEKLIKLGIDINTADMYYPNRIGIDNYPLPIEWKNGLPLLSQEIPAWSLSVLIDLLPNNLTEVGKYSTTTYTLDIRKYKFTDKVNLYQIAYAHYKLYEEIWVDMVNTDQKEEFIDAVFDIICWLLENKKL